MSESNETVTRNRVSKQLSESKAIMLGPPIGKVTSAGGTTLSARFNLLAGRVLIAVTTFVVLVAGIGFSLVASSETSADNRVRPRALAVQTVQLEPVTSYQSAREFTGTIVAQRTSRLGFELPGKLATISVDEGDTVTAGTTLAQLDTEHLETRRRQVVAKRAQALAKLDEMVAGPRVENIAAARARIVGLQAQVELLKRQTTRQKKLLPQKATSQDEYEQYAFDMKAREAQLNEAQHNLDELLNGTRKEQITAQQAVVAELSAAIADIDVDLRKSTLKAPFAGTIARRLLDDGTVVDVGQPVFRLVEDQVLEARIGLPVQAAGRLVADSLHRVKIAGKNFKATVTRRFPEVDPATRTRMVVLKLDDSATTYVVHGQMVRLKLEETVEADGFWLPITALSKGTRGLWACFVLVEADKKDSSQPTLFRVERRDIEVLHTESDRVLVRGTLNSGEQVIASGTHRVVPGQLVRLTK